MKGLCNSYNSFDEVSLHPYASLLRAGDEVLTLEDVQQRDASQFESLPNSATDLGFTNNHYWLRFSIQNATSAEQVLFLEACRPIVDVATLYELSSGSVVSKQLSGDAIPFKQRSFENRKVIFKLALKPNTTLDYYLHLKSDGEVINAGLMLRTFENLMGSEAFEQLIFGIFYGILLIAGIIYLFFFFALGERSFLYYSLYVLFIGMLQFSLDGLFYQFITPQSGWLSLNAVILSACIANFFLGRYA
ncbi:MAG: 7TM-DISM domain-containing protein, partial [Flavobacterium sp.]|nr:7TM-DISM domain-containing protein [Flavobacterium sp.]